jgi:hypothetical protein
MKKVSILKYNLKGVPVTKKTLIHRALYGYTDHSNKGGYKYERKGALESIKYTKIGNGVILLDTKHVGQLMSIFRKQKVKVSIMNLLMP